MVKSPEPSIDVAPEIAPADIEAVPSVNVVAVAVVNVPAVATLAPITESSIDELSMSPLLRQVIVDISICQRCSIPSSPEAIEPTVVRFGALESTFCQQSSHDRQPAAQLNVTSSVVATGLTNSDLASSTIDTSCTSFKVINNLSLTWASVCHFTCQLHRLRKTTISASFRAVTLHGHCQHSTSSYTL